MTSFLSKASGLIDVGFKSADTATPMNKAVAYHLKEAVVGIYPDFSIDMEKFKYEDEALLTIAKMGQGGLRDSISLLEAMLCDLLGSFTKQTLRCGND